MANRKQYRKAQDRITTPPGEVEPFGQAKWDVLAPLDAVAKAMETKWGWGRLPSLVPEEVAARFGRAKAALDDAIAEHDLTRVTVESANLRRGWQKLDELATQAGHKPLAPEAWGLEIGGLSAAIVRTPAEASVVAANMPDVQVYTLEEAGRLLATVFATQAPAIAEAKKVFPGCEVRVMQKPPPSRLGLDDEIPF